MDFKASDPISKLDNLDEAAINALPYGVVMLDSGCLVRRYNAFQSKLGGFSPESVIGQHYFHRTAPCMNNFIVGERFMSNEQPELDETIKYTFTFKMEPTNVLIRLLRSQKSENMYLLIARDNS